MATLYDAYGNQYLGQLDALTGTTITNPTPPTATLAAVNAEAVVDLNGHATLMVDIRGTFVGTMVFEGTVDGTNYIAIAAYNLVTATYAATATAAANLATNTAGFRRVRVRCTAFTSGAMLVTMRATTADFATLVERLPATAGLTVTAAVGVAATLTIPAPGAGLYQYINWIRIDSFAAAALTPAAAPVLVTTTNLPGLPIFNFRADASPQGTLAEKVIQSDMPIRAIATNGTVTVVCPATPNIIWRVTASWRVGA